MPDVKSDFICFVIFTAIVYEAATDITITTRCANYNTTPLEYPFKRAHMIHIKIISSIMLMVFIIKSHLPCHKDQVPFL